MTKMVTARVPVVSDNDRLLAAGLIPNSSEKIGITGCTQYIKENVPNPQQKELHGRADRCVLTLEIPRGFRRSRNEN